MHVGQIENALQPPPLLREDCVVSAKRKEEIRLRMIGGPKTQPRVGPAVPQLGASGQAIRGRIGSTNSSTLNSSTISTQPRKASTTGTGKASFRQSGKDDGHAPNEDDSGLNNDIRQGMNFGAGHEL